MTTISSTNTRTITGFLAQLLEYPRWLIERDVDFTNCHYDGRYNERIAQCAACGFGDACRWLNKNRTPMVDTGSVDELVAALQTAVQYLQAKTGNAKGCDCDTCSWLREARHFLRSRRR